MVSMSFYKAWHVEWSIGAVIKAIYNNKKNWTWYFSWDLGRYKDWGNFIVWEPVVPEENLDYAQIETTYAFREHPEREPIIKEMVEQINNTKWTILMASFSFQRFQEMLLILIN
jgi:Cft2 family RNA processing exonuclease